MNLSIAQQEEFVNACEAFLATVLETHGQQHHICRQLQVWLQSGLSLQV